MASNGVIKKEFFGMHVGNAGQYWPTQPIVGAWRSWDQMPAWEGMQTASGGSINWTGTDAAINAAYAKGVDIIVTFGRTPSALALSNVIGVSIIGTANPTNTWAAYSQGSNAPPQNLNDWIAFVTAFGTRYLGKVKYYEIWNEIQDTSFFSGTLGGLSDSPSAGTANYGTGSDMYNLVKSASVALKAIDPTVKIISPSATGANSLPMIIPLLKDLATGGYIDIISYHFYGGTGVDMIHSMPENSSYGTLASIKNFLSTLNVSGISRKIPVWNTEFGYPFAHGDGTSLSSGMAIPEGEWQNGVIMRSYLLAAAFGIDRSYWYAFDNTNFGCMIEPSTMGSGVVASAVAHKSCVGAFQALQYWLTGRYVSDLKLDVGNNVYSVQVTDDNGFRGLIVWNATAQPLYIPTPPGYTSYQSYALQYGGLGAGRVYPAWSSAGMSCVGGTGGASSTTLTVTSGTIIAGVVLTGAGVASGTYVMPFTTGGTTGTGGAGTYQLSTTCTIAGGTTLTALYPIPPSSIDAPVLPQLPNPISVVEGAGNLGVYDNTTYSTYSPPDTFFVASVPANETYRVGYEVAHKQYSGYGLFTLPVPAATAPMIILHFTPIMFIL